VSNDFNETTYTFKISGNGFANSSLDETSISELNVYPNPSNLSALISIGLLQDSDIKIRVLNIQGQDVAAPVQVQLSAGTQTYELNTAVLNNGVYLVELNVNGKVSRVRISVIH